MASKGTQPTISQPHGSHIYTIPGRLEGFVLGWGIPFAFGAEEDGRTGIKRYCVLRDIKWAHELTVFFAVILDRRFARHILKTEMHAPKPGKDRRGVGNSEGIAFARDMGEGEIGHHLDIGNIAIGFAKCRALDFGEILEPANTHGPDRLYTVIANDMGGLQIIAVKSMIVRKAHIFHETDGPQGKYLGHLFHGFGHFDPQGIMTNGCHGSFTELYCALKHSQIMRPTERALS